MHVLVLDTETTGLLPKDLSKTDSYPHIVQLSFRTYNTETRGQTADSIIVKPPIKIPPESSRVHGITDEIAERDGTSLREALLRLAIAAEPCTRLVGHNLSFDVAVLKMELERVGFVNFLSSNSMAHYCTMDEGRERCALVRQNRRTGRSYIKNPKLSELYENLFHASVDGLHDAHVDTAATLRCYLVMEHDIWHTPQELGIVEEF